VLREAHEMITFHNPEIVDLQAIIHMNIGFMELFYNCTAMRVKRAQLLVKSDDYSVGNLEHALSALTLLLVIM
jgi:hypothetical protein